MTDLRTAAQQALALICSARLCEVNSMSSRQEMLRLLIEATDTLRAALAEPVQEPVAWMVYTLDGKSVCVTDNPADFTDEHRVLPLYTSPPQRLPLTEEEIRQAADQRGIVIVGEAMIAFARAIERAHGIT